MAFIRQAAGFGGQSGVLGNLSMAQTARGTVMRARPQRRKGRSEAQIAQGNRLALVKRAWDALSEEEVAAWRLFSLGEATVNPQTGGRIVPAAYSLFSALGSKYLQVHGGTSVPSAPPSGGYSGDGLSVRLAGIENGLVFFADGANHPGILTELLAQRLRSPHNATRPRSYKSLGFVALAAGERVEVSVGPGPFWAGAIKFVEASSGRQTGLIEIGRTSVVPT